MSVYDDTMVGGAVLSGNALSSMPRSTSCLCAFTFTESGQGGAKCSGSADISDGRIYGSGGAKVGGSAKVDMPTRAYDGYLAVWPLQESGSPYQDKGPNNKDATSDYPPTRVAGPFCLYAQDFDEAQWIVTPSLGIGQNQAFSVSLWVAIESFFKMRNLFSLGHTDASNGYKFALFHTFINHFVAQLNTTNGTTQTPCIVASPQALSDKWYMVSVEWDGSSLSIYVNGDLAQSREATNTQTVASNNEGYIGRWEMGGYPDAMMLDVRVMPSAKGSSWWQAQYDNYCKQDFYYVGHQEEGTTPTEVSV